MRSHDDDAVDVLSTVHGGSAASLAKELAERSRIGFEAMNALSMGLAILNMQAYLTFANSAAARLIEQRVIFKPTSGLIPLTLRHPASHHALRKAVLGARHGYSTALLVRDVESKAAISAVVLPLAQSSGCEPMHEPLVLLAMNEINRSEAIPDRWLSDMFGLTRAEASVANWLVCGGSIEELAHHRGISPETARSQLKAVLSKTGVSRQAQLVAALARLPVDWAAR